VIYLNCTTSELEKKWLGKLNIRDSVQLLDIKTDIYDYKTNKTDIFILDINNFEHIKDVLIFLGTLPKDLNIIVLKTNLSLPEGTFLIKKSVKSYCHTNVDIVVLNKILKTVESGDVWVYPALMTYIIKNINIDATENAENSNILDKVSKKEKEVALLVASGNSNKEIANMLGVTLVTVKKHVSNAFVKLDVKDRVSLSILINSNK